METIDIEFRWERQYPQQVSIESNCHEKKKEYRSQHVDMRESDNPACVCVGLFKANDSWKSSESDRKPQENNFRLIRKRESRKK